MTTDQRRQPLKRFFWGLLTAGGVATLVVVMIRLWRRKLAVKRPLEESEPIHHIIHEGLHGLTEAEAEARRMEGQDNVVSFDPPRAIRDIIRDNLLTIFNFSLLGVALVQFILGRYLDALLSLGVSILNIGIQVGQELFVRKRLENVILSTRPQATVIRDGKAKSIDPSEIVKGDVLVVGPGDQFMVDGELISEKSIFVNESRITGEDARLDKHFGDSVFAGSYCVSGRAAYQAQKVGDERLVAKMIPNSPPREQVLTSLERIVERVLRVMLIIVLILFGVLLAHYFRIDKAMGVDTEAIVSAASVIFSLAPAGLFFMIFLNYVSGTAQLAKQGALVHRARSVETLAFVTDICVAQGGLRSTAVVHEEEIETPDESGKVAGSRLRQILGDFGRSNSAISQAVQMLASTYPGEERTPRAELSFLAAYGWVATVFDDDDLRGVYVLGEPQILEPYLTMTDSKNQVPGTNIKEEQERSSAKPSRYGFLGLGRFFRRKENPPEAESLQNTIEVEQTEAAIGDEVQKSAQQTDGQHSQGAQQNPFQGFFKRIGKVTQRKPANSRGEDETSAKEPETESSKNHREKLVYQFAYLPEIVDLYDSDGEPRIPQNLIPLCLLHYSNEVQPEAIETVRKIADTGMQLKIFSSGAPDRVVNALQQAGMGGDGVGIQQVIRGSELDVFEPDLFRSAVREKTVFSHATPELARQVVQTLKDDGRTVAVVGGFPSDLPAMQQAHLSIAIRKSSQVALSVADIILLKESPKAFTRVLEEGQKIVNGLLDVLKLYITQLTYLVILILLLAGAGYGFPYTSKQGSIIAIATLTIPSLGFSLWALPGKPPKVASLGRSLTWFVAPASLAIGIAGVTVFFYFLSTVGERDYARLALTHLLLVSGLVLAILVRPPTRRIRQEATGTGATEDGNATRRDWYPTVLFLCILLLLIVLAPMQWMQSLFDLDGLRRGMDYLVIWFAVLAWVVVVEIIWRTLPPKSYRLR